MVFLALPWVSALVPALQGSTARVPQELSGAQCLPAGPALALVAAAAGIGLLVTRAWGARVVAAVAMIAGLAIATLAARFGIIGPTAVLPDDAVVLGQSIWWSLTTLAGLVTTVGGLLAILMALRWQRPSSAYQRAGEDLGTIQQALTTTQVQHTRAVWWDALDRGQDPSRDDDVGR